MTKILGLLVWSCSVLLGTISAAADIRAGPHVLGDLEQPQARLVGVVRDGTGAVLQGVSVTVSGDALPASRAVVTDDQGRYAIRQLAARQICGHDNSRGLRTAKRRGRRRRGRSDARYRVAAVFAHREGHGDRDEDRIRRYPVHTAGDHGALGVEHSTRWAQMNFSISPGSCQRSQSRRAPIRRR